MMMIKMIDDEQLRACLGCRAERRAEAPRLPRSLGLRVQGLGFRI